MLEPTQTPPCQRPFCIGTPSQWSPLPSLMPFHPWAFLLGPCGLSAHIHLIKCLHFCKPLWASGPPLLSFPPYRAPVPSSLSGARRGHWTVRVSRKESYLSPIYSDNLLGTTSQRPEGDFLALLSLINLPPHISVLLTTPSPAYTLSPRHRRGL